MNNLKNIRLCDAVDNSVSEINVSLFLLKSFASCPGVLSENDAIAANDIVIDILEKCSARLSAARSECSARLSAARSSSDEDGDTE